MDFYGTAITIVIFLLNHPVFILNILVIRAHYNLKKTCPCNL